MIMSLIPPSFTASQLNQINVVVMFVQEQQSRELSVSYWSANDIPWKEYLASAIGSLFSAEVVARARAIQARIGGPVPITQCIDDGVLQMAWDNGRQYVDVEIMPDGGFHWYFRDRHQNIVDGSEDEPVQALPQEFFNYVARVTAPGR